MESYYIGYSRANRVNHISCQSVVFFLTSLPLKAVQLLAHYALGDSQSYNIIRIIIILKADDAKMGPL